MGVEVRLNSVVTNVTAEGLFIGEEFIPVRNVFWAAGVKASPLGASLGVPLDRAGRVVVGPDLTIPGPPGGLRRRRHGGGEIGRHGCAGPGRGAGRHSDGPLCRPDDRPGSGRAVARRRNGRRSSTATRDRWPSSARRRPWRRSEGFTSAAFSPGWSGAAIHIAFLIGFRNRLQVLFSWFWNWLLNARDARLITGDARLSVNVARPPEFVRGDAPDRDSDSRLAARD